MVRRMRMFVYSSNPLMCLRLPFALAIAIPLLLAYERFTDGSGSFKRDSIPGAQLYQTGSHLLLRAGKIIEIGYVESAYLKHGLNILLRK